MLRIHRHLFAQRRQRFSVRNELECDPVVAVAKTRGFWAVAKHMSLMPVASTAVILGARDNQFVVALRGYRRGKMIKETRPSGAAVELPVGGEQRLEACGAYEGAGAFFAIKRA